MTEPKQNKTANTNATEPQIMVSVCCLVYNHEPFLRECFEGFVMQKTTFPIEILVHDDASTDHSTDIIREYTAKYPDLFKPIYQTENQYTKGVSILAKYQFPRAKGKYIAICEGDDYWTDPLKLQKQVEFLEVNPEFSLCFHGRDVIKNEVLEHDESVIENDVWEINEAMHHYVPTQTVLFRNYPNIIPRKCKSLDVTLWMSLSRFGKFKYLNFNGAVYRIHDGGMWSGSSALDNYNRSINARTSCFWHMRGINRKGFARIIGNWLVWRFELLWSQKKYLHASNDAIKIVFYSFYGRNLDNMRKVKYILKGKCHGREISK